MSIQQIVIALVVGYLFGNIPNGYLYARAKGVDIFKVGSGNPGSTNVTRALGKKAGFTVLLMDIAKTVVPVLLLHLLWKPGQEITTLLVMYTGFGAILGHTFTFLPHLRGGKGVACTGALIIMFDWRVAIVLLLLLILIVLVTGYVSLGSMIGESCFFLLILLLGRSGYLPVTENTYLSCCVLSFLMAVLCVYQHRSNIQRLMHGTENKFGKKKD